MLGPYRRFIPREINFEPISAKWAGPSSDRVGFLCSGSGDSKSTSRPKSTNMVEFPICPITQTFSITFFMNKKTCFFLVSGRAIRVGRMPDESATWTSCKRS